MDQTSTFGPYFFLESSSGAAYAGLPHWVLNGSEYPKMPAQLLRPKSEGQNKRGECCFWAVFFFFYCLFSSAVKQVASSPRHTQTEAD